MKNNKKCILAFAIGVFLSLLSPLSSARTVVFIHGYMAQGAVWQHSGVIQTMQQNGWPHAGRYGFGEDLEILQDVSKQAGNATVVVELPWQENVETQAELLNRYLSAIYLNRPEPMILVGHSAGGLVARYGLVRYGAKHVESLVTIATPHLGTPMAELALLASDSPLGFLMQDLGDPSLRRSRGLFMDLIPAREGNFLGWLNVQKHPDINYFSVVRVSAPVDLSRFDQADLVVPSTYQDMNNVHSLRGKSALIATEGGHALSESDAQELMHLLNK